MPRLRRRNSLSLETPIAAEVLETRSLLAAGAAAVHQAVAHAAPLHGGTEGPHTAFKGTFANTFLNSNAFGKFNGPLTISLKPPQLNQPVSAKFHATLSSVTGATLKVTFAGTIANIQTNNIFITPTSKSTLTLTIKQHGQPTVKATAHAAGTQFELTLTQNVPSGLTAQFEFPPTAPGQFANGLFDLYMGIE
jgi:hypothetical protein